MLAAGKKGKENVPNVSGAQSDSLLVITAHAHAELQFYAQFRLDSPCRVPEQHEILIFILTSPSSCGPRSLDAADGHQALQDEVRTGVLYVAGNGQSVGGSTSGF